MRTTFLRSDGKMDRLTQTVKTVENGRG